MITFLEGRLTEKHPTRIELDVGGVGYEVFIPLSSYDRLPSAGDPCRILTHDYVREDSHQLFGFMTGEERRMFVLLLSISGIGPRLALSALSGLAVRELKRAIVEGDIKRLSSISGIGRRTAERIAMELREKLDAGDVLEAAAGETASPRDLMVQDAVLALVALGYKQADARKLVAAAVPAGGAADNVESIIKKALGG
ncbi:MAG: Holliday junction branch migration protein RuvA [Lentisphaerae bacterium]|nr:Holliday junction branch migration protein RuvA [Lentisphaerota bacterium]